MKSGGFQWISWNPTDFMWNPPENLTNQIIQQKLFSFMECSGKAMSQDFMKSAGFHERSIARNGKAYVFHNFSIHNLLQLITFCYFPMAMSSRNCVENLKKSWDLNGKRKTSWQRLGSCLCLQVEQVAAPFSLFYSLQSNQVTFG